MALLSDLVTAASKSAVLEQLVALFRLANFPTASWQPFSLLRTLVDGESSLFADKATLIADIAKGGYLDDAEKEWLTLLAKGKYNEDRKPAVATRGLLRLEDVAGTGPHTISPGQWWVTNGALRWKAIAAATLSNGGSVDVEFEAESQGAAWNIAAGQTNLELVTPGGTGVEVTNPALESGTWVTQQGADEESDTALRQRCRDKWSTLGSGSNEGAYRYWATSASSEITRVRVVADPSTGSVSVTIAGPSGPVSLEALAAAVASVEENRPLCSAALVENALASVQAVAGGVYLQGGASPTLVLAAIQSAVDALARASDIGGVVYLSRIIQTTQGVAGVRNVVLTAPVADIVLPATSVWVPSYAGLVAVT